jgi:predicted RNase H-like HicB family nuclease
MSRARVTKMQDGSYSAVVPGLRGVIATGPTRRACRSALEEVIEEWILVRVAKGLKVPTLGDAKITVRRAD